MAKKKRAYDVEEEEGADASFHRLLECFAPKARLGRIGDRSGSRQPCHVAGCLMIF